VVTVDRCGDDDTRAPSRLHNTAFWLLGQASRRAQRATQEALAEAGLRRYFYGVLATLAEFGPAAQAEIGRRLGVDPSDMVAVLNELEQLNYVRRDRNPDDRRRNRVQLTPTGAKALDRFDQAIAEAEAEFLSGLATDDQRRLLQLLQRIALIDASALDRP
jgi:DNA-binding MarR family transcriptional regulator